LAYFAEPGLPDTEQNIPLEYFVKALTWLAAQRGVDPHHLVVIGSPGAAKLLSYSAPTTRIWFTL